MLSGILVWLIRRNPRTDWNEKVVDQSIQSPTSATELDGRRVEMATPRKGNRDSDHRVVEMEA